MSKQLILGRMGSSINKNAGRRGLTCEDEQFIIAEMREKFRDTLAWLDDLVPGKYNIDCKPSFSLTGAAFEVFATFPNDSDAKLVVERAKEVDGTFLDSIRGAKI